MSRHKIICGKVQDVLFEIKTESVNLVVADPPYFKVMMNDHKGDKYEWDNQWHSFDEYLMWCQSWLSDIYRILKKNGSAYIFGDDKNIAHIQVLADKRKWCLINNIVWYKVNNMPIKGWNKFRCFAPVTERILFYGKEQDMLQYDTEGTFESIRNYLIKLKDVSQSKPGEINAYLGVSSVAERHYFAKSQWTMPTKEMYYKFLEFVKMRMEVGDNHFKFKEYEELRGEYEELRRYFNQAKNYTDVWKIPIVGGKEINSHPTQKPLKLIERTIRVSSKEGDTILAPFVGSGTDLVVAERLGRNSIGVDSSREACESAYQRLKKEVDQTKLTGERSKIEREGF